jgi:hypothetical protein
MYIVYLVLLGLKNFNKMFLLNRVFNLFFENIFAKKCFVRFPARLIQIKS